jgi:lipid-A-disaccharide synthase-like uncharacterized protein
MDTIVKLIGILGLIIIIITFILESSNKLSRNHKKYIILFSSGSLFLTVYSILTKEIIFLILNGFGVLIGIYELFIIKRHKQEK